MSIDTLLTLLNVVWGLVLTGIGIEMVNNPPGDLRGKRRYRILFGAFGAAVFLTTFGQSVRNNSEQQRLRTEASQTEKELSNKVSEQSGKLDAIAHFEQQFLTFVSQRPAGTSDASTKAYEAMALAVMKMAQGSQPPSTPPGGRLEILYEGADLNGRTIPVSSPGASGMFQLAAFHTKNTGSRATGQVSARLYFDKPITLTTMGTWQPTESEEPGFPAAFWCGGPTGAAAVNPTETWNWPPFQGQFAGWSAGQTISGKLKFFYGTDKPAVATFTIRRKE